MVKQHKLNLAKGFTLVEVMVGVSLMAMVFTGVFAVFKQSLNFVESARDYTRVTQILQSEIEAMRTYTWHDLEAINFYSTFEPKGKFVQAYKDRYSCYKYVFDRNTDQKEAFLVCSWKDNKGMYKYQIYQTFFTKDGLNDYYYRSF